MMVPSKTPGGGPRSTCGRTSPPGSPAQVAALHHPPLDDTAPPNAQQETTHEHPDQARPSRCLRV